MGRFGGMRCGLLAIGAALLVACGGEEPEAETGDAPEAAGQRTAEGVSPNRAPEIESISIDPSAPTAGETLQVWVEASDPDGDDVKLFYDWRADGVKGEGEDDRFELRAGEKGGQIQVRVTASDGTLQATKTASVRVGNQPPILQAVVLEPLDEVRAGRDVTASPRATDPDGDEIEYEYLWSVNGRTIPGDTDVLSHEHYARGDVIEVRVIASDGQAESDALESAPIPVVNAPPRITSRPGSFEEDGSFRYAIAAADPDGDTQFRYRLLAGPDGMEIDRADGTVLWWPVEAQAGQHDVEVEVTDVKGGRATQRFVISLAFEDEEVPPASAAEPSPEP